MIRPLGVSCGGGINSAAMLVGMAEKQLIPDFIEFVDTAGPDPLKRGEKPETYDFVDTFLRPWCIRELGVGIVTLAHTKKSLRQSCLDNGTLPSKAYGMPGCSVKFKHQIMEAYETKVYGPTEIITKAIGYHANEGGRSDIADKGRYRYLYPLREWGWRQQECIEALKRAGLPIPVKSACYFCPSSKPHEIVWLSKTHPNLFADCVAMEHNAAAYHATGGNQTKGLARRFSWEHIVAMDEAQFDLLPEPVEINCMCDDGEAVEKALEREGEAEG